VHETVQNSMRVLGFVFCVVEGKTGLFLFPKLGQINSISGQVKRPSQVHQVPTDFG